MSMATSDEVLMLDTEIGTTEIPGVFLYLNCDADLLPDLVRKALNESRQRWSDQAYLTRMLVDRLSEWTGFKSPLGLGVSIRPVGWSTYPFLVIDVSHQEVWLMPRAVIHGFDPKRSQPVGRTVSFEEFATGPVKGWSV